MRNSTWMFVIFLLHLVCGLTSGTFLQAISAALATIPFTGGPIAMTAGLAGVKLAVGSKLLYFLGYFGRRQKNAPKPSPGMTSFGQKWPSSLRSPFPQGFSAVPLPYMLGAGGGAGGFGRHQLGIPPQAFPQSFPSQQFGGGGPQFNPVQLMQAYGELQGAGGYGGFPGGYGNPQMGFPNSAGGGSNFPQLPYDMGESQNVNEGSWGAEGMSPQGTPPNTMQQETSPDQMSRPQAGGSEADIDNFFNFLGEMDDNMCISRLICDIGADPNFLGEFSQNIDNIISTLEVPADSRANHYVSIMQQGREERGGCAERFTQCNDGAYEIVKSVAPTVGVPSNLEDLNLS